MSAAGKQARKPVPALKTILASSVKTRPVSWLWVGHVPYGKVTIIDGDPGIGKSVLTVSVASAQTNAGELPGGGPTASAPVLLLSGEDDAADTTVPRLKAANANLDLIHLPGDEFAGIQFPTDIETIRAAIIKHGIRLLVIDPLMDYLDPKLDAHKDQDVRKVTRPLAALARETGCAIVLVRHLNKAAGKSPMYRGGGSIGISGAARSVMVVGYEPGSSSVRVIAPIKSNLSRNARSLKFTIETAGEVMRVAWLGESEYGADEILAAPTDPGDRSALETAVQFLRELLTDGPLKSTEVTSHAKGAGISEKTLERARASLKCKASRSYVDGKWRISLPTATAPSQDEPGANG
jgi:AAA domain